MGSKKTNISRRQFLKGAATGVVGVAAFGAFGCGAAPSAVDQSNTPGTQTPSMPSSEGPIEQGILLGEAEGALVATLRNDARTEYDGIYDVLVLGAGAAGLAAAHEAASAGATVLIIECEPGVLQSNTALCGGVVMGCRSSVQKAANIADDPTEFIKYLKAVGAGYEDEEMMTVWAQESGMTVDWLQEIGVSFPVEKLYFSGNEEGYAHITPAVPRGCITAEDSGSSISLALEAKCLEKGVEFAFETIAERLLTDPDGRVVGVCCDKGTYRGNKAVVVCTAGFSRNKEWIKSFKPDLSTGGSFGSSRQQGDGIRMGMALGAKIGNMWITQADTIGTQLTEQMCPCMVIAIWKLPCMFVSQDGLRHMSEDLYYEYQCGEIAKQPGGYVWSIWDQSITDMGSSVITVPACSPGCEEEIANGTMFKADTIEDLATQLEIDPETLASTLRRYNEMMRKGADEDFGRGSGLGEVKKAPFYAAKTVPATCDTAGGLITNVDGQVMNHFDEKIPGLYAAGSTTSGWRGELYPGSGTAVSIALTFGRRAGRKAAAESGSLFAGKLSANPAKSGSQGESDLALAENEFVGVGNGMGGKIKVKVTLNGKQISKVEVIEHKETQGIGTPAIEQLPAMILQAQSAQVEAISGATITSLGITDAVKDALNQAGWQS